MFCEKCGKELFDEAVICPNCGCPTRNYYAQQPQQPPRSQPQYQQQYQQPISNRLTPNQEMYFNKVNTVYGLSIAGMSLCFGIGIIFVIISALLKNQIPTFEGSDDEYVLYLYRESQKKLSVSNKLIAATSIIFISIMAVIIIITIITF